jgi:signal transduction histidine kinase/DNA-binding response OmpR family regulator
MGRSLTNKHKFGLRGRAILVVASLIVSAVLGASVSSALRTNDILRQNQSTSIDGFGSGLAAAIELSLAVGDVPEMKRLTGDFLELIPNARFIVIKDHAGSIQTAESTDLKVYELYLSDQLGDDQYSVSNHTIQSQPHGFGNETGLEIYADSASIPELTSLGTIVIGVSNQGLRDSQLAQWRASFVTLGIVMLVSLPLIFVFISGWTSRLTVLIRSSKLMTKGDYSRPIADTKNDEISELYQAYEHMRVSIKDRNESEQRRQRELSEARETADNANQAKSQFLAHMSHEIRTPINGVVGMLELLSMTKLSEKQRKQVTTATSSADALLSLINDILDFSKIEAGQFEIDPTPMDLYDTVEGVAEMLAHKANDHGIELICDIAQDVPRSIVGDSTKLRQIVINLVNNAIKFTSEGEVVIRVSCLSQTDDSHELKIAVSDTGIGIPVEQRNRLFKSFSQIDASTTRKYGGTGLGLAISKGFVELMDGEIGISPDREVGSEFWFTFKAGYCEQEYQPKPVFQGVLNNMKAIIVDDNQTNRDIYTEALKNWGLRPEAFPDAPSALSALRDTSNDDPFELAILDMQMPGMDGVQLADSIQSDSQIQIPVMVMLTSMFHTADSKDLANLSLAACLQKPVRLSTLHDAIAQYMSDGKVAADFEHADQEDHLVDLAGARALVAEDNPVNQMVVSELLKSVGIDVVLVDNGADAVANATTGNFSFVLMDCEMPEVDGYEATKWIRTQEHADVNSRKIPIIALTANAIQGDRERCIDAGMDDYLTKPINAKKLFETLRKWYVPSEKSTCSQDTRAPQTATVEFNGPVDIDVDGALERCAGSNQVLCKVLEEFVRTTDSTNEQLESLLEGSDFKAMQSIAHSLKGSAANIGADTLASYAQALESVAKDQVEDDILQSVSELAISLDQLRAGLPNLMTQLKEAA